MSDLFEKHGHAWWDEQGPFSALHAINHVRLEFMTRYLPQNKNFTVLDVGCGGGLVSVPLARLGARVVGVDASGSAIEAARSHAHQLGLDIDYRVGGGPTEGEMFDVVCALELVEHVEDPYSFLKRLLEAVKPDGVLFISSINRTWCSWFKAIVAAEYVLNWVPRGTHDWHAFLSPGEVAHMLRPQRWKALKGLSYVWGQWRLSDALDTNYIGCIYREGCG